MTWLNNDGLWIKLGPSEVTPSRGGFIRGAGPLEVIEFDVNLVDLTSTAAIMQDALRIPRGARIERVQVVNEVAATSGGAATLNIGTINEDRTTGGVATNLVNAAALATVNAPAGRVQELTVGATGAGGALGTTLAAQALITANWGTAAFTAGRLTVRVFYYIP